MRTIDLAKCIGCGKCVADCVNQYLELVEDDEHQKKAAFAERGRCLNCGHCNAICPTGAINGGNIEFYDDVDDQLLNLMARKRTVRNYSKGVVIPQDVMGKIIRAGQSAPTNRNRKSARIVMLKEQLPYAYNLALDYLVEEVQKTGNINPLYIPTMRMAEKRDEILWNAEYLVLFAGSPQSIVDAVIAAERMQLEASSLGVGTAYRGDMQTAFNNVKELRELLELRSNEQVLVAYAMGMSDCKYLRPAVKENRKVIYI